jgi:hypothetical protein
METTVKPLTSVKQLPKPPATYRDLIKDISSLPYPIGHFDSATACEAIGMVLSDVYKMMNSKDHLDQGALANMISWVRFNYKYLHPLEVKVAYDMYLAGQLKVQYLGSQLNQSNLAKLLNTYVEYKTRLLKSIEELNKSKETKKEDKNSPEKLREKHIEFLKTVVLFYERFKQGNHEVMMYMFYVTYDTLVKYKLIDDEAPDHDLMDKAKAIFRSRHLSERNASPLPVGEALETEEKRVYKELKVIRAFQELQFNETDLEKYLMERVR